MLIFFLFWVFGRKKEYRHFFQKAYAQPEDIKSLLGIYGKKDNGVFLKIYGSIIDINNNL